MPKRVPLLTLAKSLNINIRKKSSAKLFHSNAVAIVTSAAAKSGMIEGLESVLGALFVSAAVVNTSSKLMSELL